MIGNIFIVKWFDIFRHPMFLIRKGIEHEIKDLSKELKGNLLDFGCGSKPYKKIFNSYPNLYWA